MRPSFRIFGLFFNDLEKFYKVSTGPVFSIKSYKSLYLKNGPIKTYKSYNFAYLVSWTFIFIEVTKKTATNMRSKKKSNN